MLSRRVRQIDPSETLRIAAMARQLKEQGVDVIDLSVGEPDFPTPSNIKEAGKKAIDRNITRYTPNPGLPELRAAVAEKLRRDNNVSYEPDEIIISPGAKNCLFIAWMALLDEGHEVIIPSPYWVTYPQQVLLAGGKPVVIDTMEEDGFKLRPRALESVINEKTKAIIINNPCNPTGTAYTRDELASLCTIAADRGLYIVADEIYEKLVYDEFDFTSIGALGEHIKQRAIIINGVSKSYSMTGWRLGFAAAPREIIDAMNKIQSHNTSNACSISQVAALEALRGPQDDVTRMVREFQQRRDYMLSRLKEIPRISCVEPTGAFYVFPNFSAYYDTEYDGMHVRNSVELAHYLLTHANVAVVPGSAFGRDKYIRLSYAASMEEIRKAMDRIADAVARLKPST